jgi:hypothetical protein
MKNEGEIAEREVKGKEKKGHGKRHKAGFMQINYKEQVTH